ncbi:diguanylate cyclase [Falsigemmobacter intermedius]|uniref:diguanylate cyclase n=1 Tax=Falsigemmobacter intermedius TaxID=1553448 RepID=A0A3S3UC33_9RHOB|nr:diguanylate cyclase [Falsigemmobacter intermedius]RWY38846.1 diguanylate cyclase [Falsigemmobacter intermedius]
MNDLSQASANRAVILIVDDEISNVEIIYAALGDDYEISFATSGEEALEVARLTQPDLVLLDVVMPGMQGFEVCQRLKEDPLLADIPVIFTTGLGNVEDEVRGLSLGAIDYVTKPIQPMILRNRVRNHIELKQLRDRLALMAVTDALTGLHNRRKLDGLLSSAVNTPAAEGSWLSIIMIDVDFFKQFNDTYGHETGDRCLHMVASALSRAMRQASGYTARYGGEEFACVLPGSDLERAMEIAGDIRRHVGQLAIPHEGSQVQPYVTISMGVAAALIRAGMQPGLWIRAADQQLYLAKAAGRDQIKGEVFTSDSAF